MLTVFLVDDHEMVRRGVAELLDHEPDITVIGQAASMTEALVRIQATQPDRLTHLTAQELTLLDLIGEGLSNRQIATRMFLAEKTVKNYVSRLLRKLGVERRTQIAVLATELRDHRPLEDHST